MNQPHNDAQNAALLLNVSETASLLRVSRDTVYAWSVSGYLPSVKVGRLIRFRRADLAKWLESRLSR